jgi:hypothetical protein
MNRSLLDADKSIQDFPCEEGPKRHGRALKVGQSRQEVRD